MRLLTGSYVAIALFLLIPAATNAQDESSRTIAGGGISAPGWTGRVDANEAAHGLSVKDARFTESGGKISVTTGPAGAYWKSSDKASGNYTVKATFNEPKFMNLNSHPHPYGVFIGGNDMGTDQETYLYCAAYGDGNFIVRGFGPRAFQMNGFRGASNPAVHKAAGVGQPVTQEIAMSVKGDQVSCSINGAVVASYPKSEVVGTGKLKSLDGAYGLRFAHNTEAQVAGFSAQKD